jgi:hypothetical protein
MNLAMAVGDNRHYVIDGIAPRHFVDDRRQGRNRRIGRAGSP